MVGVECTEPSLFPDVTSLSHWPAAVAGTVVVDALLLRSAVFSVRLVRNRLQVSRCATSVGSLHLSG